MGYAVMGTATGKRRPPRNRRRTRRHCLATARSRRYRRRTRSHQHQRIKARSRCEVNEASTLSSVRHTKHGQYYFGAVLDEKMKDRSEIPSSPLASDSASQRSERSVTYAGAAIEKERTFPWSFPLRPLRCSFHATYIEFGFS